MTLKQLIQSKKFDYVNSDITPENFPLIKREHQGYKLFHFDRRISSEDAISDMKKGGYSPATIYELLEWKERNEEYIVIALGSVGKVDGSRCVLRLGRGDSERILDLSYWGGDWRAYFRFLGVRTLPLESEKAPSAPAALGILDKAIRVVKEAGYKVIKEM